MMKLILSTGVQQRLTGRGHRKKKQKQDPNRHWNEILIRQSITKWYKMNERVYLLQGLARSAEEEARSGIQISV